LKALEDDTRQIRITGLTTRRAEPYFFGIDEIYISLTTLASQEAPGPDTGRDLERQRRVALETALSQRRVVVVGDPVPASPPSCGGWRSSCAARFAARGRTAPLRFWPRMTGASRS